MSDLDISVEVIAKFVYQLDGKVFLFEATNKAIIRVGDPDNPDPPPPPPPDNLSDHAKFVRDSALKNLSHVPSGLIADYALNVNSVVVKMADGSIKTGKEALNTLNNLNKASRSRFGLGDESTAVFREDLGAYVESLHVAGKLPDVNSYIKLFGDIKSGLDNAKR